MTQILWDQVGERVYETGVDHGVLYLLDNNGAYSVGVGWNGLVTVTESPSGAEAQPQYADNIKYLNIRSAEDFGGTIEAFTYPAAFAECDGSALFYGGLTLGQQGRRTFGLAYRSRVGNDVAGNDFGYKLHLVYGATASPSERAYGTINDSPEPITFSWEFATTPTGVGTINGKEYKPTSSLVLDSTKLPSATMAAVEALLYGTAGSDPSLPDPATVIGMFAGSIVSIASLSMPAYNSTTKVITIPSVTGVKFTVDGVTKAAGPLTITKNTVVKAVALSGYQIASDQDTDWGYTF